MLHSLSIDMIFSEDSILLSLFDIYEDEEELKNAIFKYCQSSFMDKNKLDSLEIVKGEMDDLAQVILVSCYHTLGHKPHR